MDKKQLFDLLRGALSSIEFYGQHYSSTEAYAKHKLDVAQMLRGLGRGHPSYAAVLDQFADALEKL